MNKTVSAFVHEHACENDNEESHLVEADEVQHLTYFVETLVAFNLRGARVADRTGRKGMQM
jgi:hypothetical protein